MLIVSCPESAVAVQEALSVGAHGYVFKTAPANDLLLASEAVANHESFVSQSA